MDELKSKITAKYKNLWSTPDELPRLPVLDLVILALSTLLPTLCFVIPNSDIVALAVCAIAILLSVRYVRSVGVMPYILPAALLAGLFYSLTPAAIFLSVVISVGSGAYLLAICAKKYPKASAFLILIPALSYGLGYLISSDAILSLLTLVTYPAAILLAIALCANKERVPSICHASAGIFIGIATTLAVILFKKYGACNIGILQNAIADARIFCENYLNDIFTKNADYIAKLTESMGGAAAEQILKPEVIVSVLFNYIPMALLLACNILAFSAQSLTSNIATFFDKELISPKNRRFVMSAPAAIVFLLAGIVNAIAYMSAAEFATIVAETIYVVLLPGFLLGGIASFLSKMSASKGKGKLLPLLLIFIFLPCLWSVAITLLAINGALNTLAYRIFEYKLSRINKKHNDNDNDKDK